MFVRLDFSGRGNNDADDRKESDRLISRVLDICSGCRVRDGEKGGMGD
jgi:hypothetical protein